MTANDASLRERLKEVEERKGEVSAAYREALSTQQAIRAAAHSRNQVLDALRTEVLLPSSFSLISSFPLFSSQGRAQGK